MRRAGTIYRQYRQIRKLALIRTLAAARRKIHDNCHYGRKLEYYEPGGTKNSVRLCMFKPNDPDICENPHECNAYARKWSDEAVIEQFSKTMANESAKKRLFPELWAYEWVLDKSLTEANKSEGKLSRLIMWVIAILENILRKINARNRDTDQGDKDA